LNIDYDPTPVPGFASFAELLEIIHCNISAEALSKACSDNGALAQSPQVATEPSAESPFEDVSARRLARVLVESFQAERFITICPFIQPEMHIPHYRTEKERIFQHHIATTLIDAGEHAIARGEADGQWFLFNFNHERPAHSDIKQPFASGERGYLQHLEAEIERKNMAIKELEARVRRREADFVAARKLVLPSAGSQKIMCKNG
ncbi:MAG: hypothetical protein IVW55_18090, partial [Chloroflexi bacterium]|nr:hypothetical protein [Chloroflexota bacterium]